jgi:hypothetical protein
MVDDILIRDKTGQSDSRSEQRFMEHGVGSLCDSRVS